MFEEVFPSSESKKPELPFELGELSMIELEDHTLIYAQNEQEVEGMSLKQLQNCLT